MIDDIYFLIEEVMDARTLMDAHFWMGAYGRSFLDGRSSTLAGRRSDVLGLLRTTEKFGHATVTVTVTLQNHKKYYIFYTQLFNSFPM
jgi:hypothetical protein